MKWVVFVAAVVAAGSAFAQAANPSVAPFPLQVIRPVSLSEKQLEDLQATLKVLMRRMGVAVPDSAKLGAALKDLKRADCDRDNECLVQLAKLSGSLYGLFAAVDLSAEGDVLAWGRVVRDDGKLVAEVSKEQQVKLPRGKEPFPAVAEQALMKLVGQLNVHDLPATKPVEPVEPVVHHPVEVVPTSPVVEQPPPETSRRKMAGYTALGVGALSAVTGVVLLGAGAGVGGGSIDPASGYVKESRLADFRTARTVQTTGGVLLGCGAAVAMLGLVLSMGGDEAPKVTLAPIAEGAMVGIGGALP